MIFKKTYVLTLFLIVITVISCSKDKTDLPLPCLEDPSFDQIIKPIFQNNCVDCHNSNYAEGNVILEDYISTIKFRDFYIKFVNIIFYLLSFLGLIAITNIYFGVQF